MTTTTRVRPSDVVVWRVDERTGRHVLVRLNGTQRFTERRPGHTFGTGTFHAVIEYHGHEPLPLLDTESRQWRLWTQGSHKSSRRYQGYVTLTEAQETAVRWLDRRFKVDTES